MLKKQLLPAGFRLMSLVVLLLLALVTGCGEDACVGPPAGSPEVVLVTPDGHYEFATIQDAVNASADGDTVRLAGGRPPCLTTGFSKDASRLSGWLATGEVWSC
jgi:hypothetical protein